MASFDPYHQWLGISPAEQPPDHYRLLGINRFEDNPSVIENAADRQMAHLKTFQTGPHSADSQRLLNQIASARICLLNTDKKTAYDLQLREKTADKSAATKPRRDSVCDTPSPLPSIDVKSSPGRRRSPSNRRYLIFAALFFTTIAVFSSLMIFGSGKSFRDLLARVRAKTNSESKTDVDRTKIIPSGPIGPAQPNNSTLPAVKDGPDEDEAFDNEKRGRETSGEALHKGSAKAQNLPASGRSWTSGSGPKPHGRIWNNQIDPKPRTRVIDSMAKPSRRERTANTKLPVPSADEQKEIATLMEKAYDFSKAKNVWEKKALAQQLYGAGMSSRGTDGESYVLFSRAAELAVLTGDAAMVFRAIDAAADRYNVDRAALDQKMLKCYASGPKTPERLAAFRAACIARLDGYLSTGRLDEALAMAKNVMQAAQQFRDKKLRKESLVWKKAIADYQQAKSRFLQASQKLADEPDDRIANLTVGRWRCLHESDFSRGMPYLIKGSDQMLAALAKKEVETVAELKTSEAQADLGDAWWNLAEKSKGSEAFSFRKRAVYWYERSFSHLSGLKKIAVEKRLKLFNDSNSKASSSPLASLLGYGEAVIERNSQATTWQFIVCCDDAFVMHINGIKVLDGKNANDVHRTMLTMSPGDVITVQAENHRGPRGFCCLMRSPDGHVITSGPGWLSYRPTNIERWYDPDLIGRTMPSQPGNSRPLKKRQEDIGINVPEIWGHGQTCYLMFNVP